MHSCMKDESLYIRCPFLSLDLNGISKWHKIFLSLPRAVAIGFFVTGGIIASAQRHEPCMRVWGYALPEKFQIWRLRNAIFKTCHEICLLKIDLEDENGKQLHITIIKITESKEQLPYGSVSSRLIFL